MAIRNIVLATAAAALAASPVLAQASLDRATAPVEGEEGGGTSGFGIIAGILAAAAIIAGIIIAADGGDDEGVSP
jgi:hypothetical protein